MPAGINDFIMAGKRKKKNSVKMAVTYIVTIIITLILAGGVCWYMYENILGDNDDEIDYAEIEQLVKQDDYVPSAEDNRTLLLILDAEKRESGSAFLAVHFNAVKEAITVMPIQSNTLVNLKGETDTVYNFFRNGGTTSAIEAVSACTGVDFDHYIKFSSSGFETIVDIFGGVDFNVPYPLIYSNPDTGEETIIKEGRGYLDSTALRKLITYPDFKSGEEYRAKCIALTVTDMLNASVDDMMASHLDEYFNLVVNSDVETDITAYDYQEVSEAMKYVAENAYNPAVFVLSTGVTNENGHYTLDESFTKNINEWFLLDKNDNIDLDAPMEKTAETLSPQTTAKLPAPVTRQTSEAVSE